MSISFNSKKFKDLFFNGSTAKQIFYGAQLVWQKNVALLIMGNEKHICIEYVPTKNLISSSQNPITISVFMNTSDYTTTTPTMWILDAAGVTCGYSNTGVVGAQETIDGCTGYKRTNTFRDNQLFLISGKTYYIIYKINEWDTSNNYFAYYEDNTSAGHYKTYNVNGGHSTVHDLTDKTDIGSLTSFIDVINASNNDLFIWNGITKSGLTSGYEYYRNNDSLNNYVSELNYGSTDKYEVLNHILMMDKGSGQYGGAGDKFVITESYTDGPIGVISRTSNYTSHVFIPPSQSFFHRNADAYKYIFDPAVNLTENKALVWGNEYIYTYGSCYSRGSQYLGYTCYESRTQLYIDIPGDIAKVNQDELFYIEQSVASLVNSTAGLKIRGSQKIDAVAIANSSDSSPKQFATIAVQLSHGTVWFVGDTLHYPLASNKLYTKNGSWNVEITSTTPLTSEPSNPATDDVYYKAGSVTWGSISDECIIKWNGSSWVKINEYEYGNYFSYKDAQNIFSDANINGILTEFQPSQLYQEENISTLVTRVEGEIGLVNAELKTGKRHYLEVIEVNGV
jgi:hypothetical protein